MKKIIIILSLFMATASFAQEQVGKYAEIFTGNRGFTVTVVRYGDFSKKQALIKLSGYDHPWEGKVFLCNVSKSSGKTTYTTKIGDADWALLNISGNEGTVYPKDDDEFRVKYISSSTSTNDLLIEYNAQSKPKRKFE